MIMPFKTCNVCYGTPGKYPVIDRFGEQLYEIRCPHCDGLGQTFEVVDLTEKRKAAQSADHDEL